MRGLPRAAWLDQSAVVAASGDLYALPGMPQRRRDLRTPEKWRADANRAAQSAAAAISTLHDVSRAHPRLQCRREFSSMIIAPKIAPALALLLWLPAAAQPTVAPASGESAGPAQGENAGGYNIVQNWELDYRFPAVGGQVQKYSAVVEYHEGYRLFSCFVGVH